ncbi:protein-disulfide isomerase [Enemella dayhoffiae]|uniref:Protein-disulfide isomerase n=1 Tax=Enemella dayhoffiae TaxID=2016507 RepID=A0A255GWW5_9ACTN|nr:DsbA family oxidoreductase [Enemella dayhoffiae]OYO18064.1 protein-disulfide isomerase [Enemella dayhoffiae]
MKIDIWSDIVCPFCYLGKRELELALADFEHRDQVQISWRSFELDPTIEPVSDNTLVQKIASKYGISEAESEQSQRQIAERAASLGLTFNWQQARFGNTFDAHRLVHLARELGLEQQAYELLLRAYFTDGVAVGDPAELQRLGEEIGLPEQRVRRLLSSDEFAAAVRADEQEARSLGISGVPFFVFADRYAVSGAQPQEVFANALAKAWQDTHPAGLIDVGPSGEACGPDGC